MQLVTAALLVIGVFFILVAAIGVVRMPDLFLRMSAVSKAATLGAACVFAAVALDFGDIGVSARAFAAIAFLILTAPVASHLIGRAGYITGVELWRGTARDDLRGCYDRESHELSATPRLSRWREADEHEA